MSNPTRDKIITTTSELIERQGYHATGLNQIVQESGTPRGSLYYYFPAGKEELATEAVRQRMAMMANHLRGKLSEVDDPAEAIYALIVEFSERMAQHDCGTGAPIAAVALETSNTSEQIRQACAAGYQGLQDVFAAKLIMGGFPAEQARALAVTVNAAVEGGMILGRTNQDAGILLTVANSMKRLIESMR